jgi:hypothetical protein
MQETYFGDPSRWEDNINMDLKIILNKFSWQRMSYENGNEPSAPIEDGFF